MNAAGRTTTIGGPWKMTVARCPCPSPQLALPVLKILARAWLWNALPNGRHAHFFNIWAGKALAKDRFRARLRADLTAVFDALRRGDITAPIADRLPLEHAAEALRLAESGTVSGKVILTP